MVFFNSVVLVFFSITGQVIMSSFVAFGFARLRCKGKNLIFFSVALNHDDTPPTDNHDPSVCDILKV